MANFTVDLFPFVPHGFHLVPREIVKEPTRMRCFLAFSIEKANEDLAIAITDPKIAKDDFWPFARELRHFLLDNGVHEPEVQQCPMGEAFVKFDSPLQRDAFVLSNPRQFNDYQIRFIRHDEGPNLKELDLDRSVWLMLLCFPPDARNLISLVDKSLAGFCQLISVHRSSSMARLIVRVLINKDANIPDSITISVGTLPRIRTWTVPVYLLHASDAVLGGDEEPLPVDGPTHPMPFPEPGWMGPQGQPGNADNVVDEASENVAPGGMAAGADMQEAMQVPQSGLVQEAQGDRKDKEDTNLRKLPSASPFSSASADFAASRGIKEPSPKGPATARNQVIFHCSLLPPPFPLHSGTFSFLSAFLIDLSIKVPSYISDHSVLWYLAKVALEPEEFARGMKRGLEDMDANIDDDDVKLISKEEAAQSSKTPRKRRARKPRAPLGVHLVRRSRRLNKDLYGYRSKAAKLDQEVDGAMPAVDEPKKGEGEDAEDTVVLEPKVLTMVPATDEAPVF
ncbi:unnamed protein product [Urochloa humidicola]